MTKSATLTFSPWWITVLHAVKGRKSILFFQKEFSVVFGFLHVENISGGRVLQNYLPKVLWMWFNGILFLYIKGRFSDSFALEEWTRTCSFFNSIRTSGFSCFAFNHVVPKLYASQSNDKCDSHNWVDITKVNKKVINENTWDCP